VFRDGVLTISQGDNAQNNAWKLNLQAEQVVARFNHCVVEHSTAAWISIVNQFDKDVEVVYELALLLNATAEEDELNDVVELESHCFVSERGEEGVHSALSRD